MSSEAEAAQLLKRATRLCRPSVISLRLRPEWEEATPLFERAGQIFQQCGRFDEARNAYEKAAEGQERLGSLWHSAKDLERAAEAAASATQYETSQRLFKASAEAFRLANRQQAAADVLAKCARTLEEFDAKVCMELYRQAIEIVEEEGKMVNSGDLYRQAVSLMVRQQWYADAAGMLLRYAASCEETHAKYGQCRAYLGAVVVWLHAQEAREAWLVYQDALGVAAFASSEQALAAEALLNGYRTGERGEIQQVVGQRHSVFADLETAVARLALKLPQGDVAAMAEQLTEVDNAQGDDEEEVDLR